MTRPEAGGGYGWEDHNLDQQAEENGPAWQEMTPWRPGDKSTRDEQGAASFWGSAPTSDAPERARIHREYVKGDKVTASRALGGILGSGVPQGARGEVESIHVGVFEATIRVRFENGLTEDVNESSINYDSGWY